MHYTFLKNSEKKLGLKKLGTKFQTHFKNLAATHFKNLAAFAARFLKFV